MKTLFSLFFVCLITAPLLPLASAHGVCTGISPRFGRLDDVHFSSQTIQTGDAITITGNITTMVQQNLYGFLSIHSSPSPHARWAIVTTEPNEKIINITQFSKVPFSMTVKALQPGTYKLSPVLYLPGIGPAFGVLDGCNTEPMVTVAGDPICNQGFVGVLKTEDGSPVCVKPETAKTLVERGWASNTLSHSAHAVISMQTMNVTNSNLFVNYTITNAKILDIKADTRSASIIISMQASGNGNLDIVIPRILVEYPHSQMDPHLFVLGNGQEIDSKEIKTTPNERTLSIPFKADINQIEIIGAVCCT